MTSATLTEHDPALRALLHHTLICDLEWCDADELLEEDVCTAPSTPCSATATYFCVMPCCGTIQFLCARCCHRPDDYCWVGCSCGTVHDEASLSTRVSKL